MPALVISTPRVNALIYIQGAQLAQWQPVGHTPVLFMSSASQFEPGQAIRGGVPVIAPWFGPSDAGRHGWARNLDWELTSIDESDDGDVVVRLELPQGRVGAPLSTEVSLTLEIRLGARLSVKLSATNTSDHTIRPELALHAYWALEARALVASGIEMGGRDSLNSNAAIPAGPFEALTGQAVDRFYPFDAPIVLQDAGNQREIKISSPDATNAVVWNPGITGSAASADMDAEDWTRFICVEAARARDARPIITPGTTAQLSLHAEVAHL